MKQKRDHETGRWKATKGATITAKGYLRITAGPFRNVYLHRLLGAFKVGRPLTKDEDVHHKNGVKLDFGYDNLVVTGHREHGCVSAKQHFYLEQRYIHLKGKWDAWFESEEQVQ